MKKIGFSVLLPLFLVLSCTSKPAAGETSAAPLPVIAALPIVPAAPAPRLVVPAPGVIPGLLGGDASSFDPGSVPQEVFDYTKRDVQNFIENLNRIIRSRNYEGWIAHLGEDYLKEKNSRDYLLELSEQPRLKAQGIILASARGYFVHVVAPSRFHDRVDDIEFVSARRVKAYTVTGNGQRLRLYDLEYMNGTWKIIN